MQNEFKFNETNFNDVFNYIVAASNESPSIIADINKLVSAINSINLPGKGAFTNVTNVIEVLNKIEQMPLGLSKMAVEAIKAKLDFDGFNKETMNYIVSFANSGVLTPEDFIALGAEYAKEFSYVEYNDITNNKYNKLQQINCPTTFFQRCGLSDEFINKLNGAFAADLINNNLMYTGDGVIRSTEILLGTLAMMGGRLRYQLGASFDRDNIGLYFGTRGVPLRNLDCVNFFDWGARCAGFNISDYNHADKYKLADDGITPKDEIRADSSKDYFYNAKPGDIASNSTHIVVINGKAEGGYYVSEEGGINSANARFYSYEELDKRGFLITNMDGLYRNTGTNYDSDTLFFEPEEIIKELNLDPESNSAKELYRQYYERNKATSLDNEIIDVSSEYIPDLNQNIE